MPRRQRGDVKEAQRRDRGLAVRTDPIAQLLAMKLRFYFRPDLVIVQLHAEYLSAKSAYAWAQSSSVSFLSNIICRGANALVSTPFQNASKLGITSCGLPNLTPQALSQ